MEKASLKISGLNGGKNSINIGEKFSGKIRGKNGGKISIKIIEKHQNYTFFLG